MTLQLFLVWHLLTLEISLPYIDPIDVFLPEIGSYCLYYVRVCGSSHRTFFWLPQGGRMMLICMTCNCSTFSEKMKHQYIFFRRLLSFQLLVIGDSNCIYQLVGFNYFMAVSVVLSHSFEWRVNFTCIRQDKRWFLLKSFVHMKRRIVYKDLHF